jgi:hypothetical protein
MRTEKAETQMRCYFFRRRGHYVAAAPLSNFVSDTDAISQAETLFSDRIDGGGELSGFEVWEDDRLVYCFTSGNENRTHPRDVSASL